MNKIILSAAAALLLTSASAFAASNNSPPAGAILDLAGGETGTAAQTINHDSSNPTTESVSFVAGNANTDITFALREDPAFFFMSNITLVDTTTPSGNLILNGDFSLGTQTSGGNSNAAVDWTFDNVFGATFEGVVDTSNCGTAYSTCWDDGSVLAYDAIDQFVATTVGDTYTLSFQYWDNGGLTTFEDISSDGEGVANITAYALAGLPVACPPGTVCTTTPTSVPEPITLTLFGAGLVGAGALRRKAKKAA